MIESPISKPKFITQCLSQKEWRQRRKFHEQTVANIVDPYLQKKQHQHKDPVLDFLFDYYVFRPSHLKRWSPGFGVMLERPDQHSAPHISELTIKDEGAFLDPVFFPEKRKKSARWIRTILENSLKKEPAFGCFGMHEWAMVYRAKNVRHNQLPLRMSKEKLAAFVESRPLVCTHFDAFRFFTKPARPLNKYELSRDSFTQNEQAGCLHTNMDLYKWSFKLFPWISSDTIRSAFCLAVDTRIIDMQASPYDLREHGLEPIKIETKKGRLEYVTQQKNIYQRSLPLREQLIEEYQRLITYF